MKVGRGSYPELYRQIRREVYDGQQSLQPTLGYVQYPVHMLRASHTPTVGCKQSRILDPRSQKPAVLSG